MRLNNWTYAGHKKIAMPNNNRGLFRFIDAAGYSWKGFKSAYKNEEAFRQELILFCILAPLGLWLGETGIEKALLVGCLIIVLIVELLNSAIEAVVDRIGLEKHELSGRAKDIGSAAVTLSILLVVAIWGLLLFA